MTNAALIAVDWGTTNRRGYLIGAGGAVLDRRADGLGLTNIEGEEFATAFDALAAPWFAVHGDVPALLSGMIGASTGWREAPYCGLPAGLDDLASNLVQAPGDRPVWIVPGVAVRAPDAMPDVIRGEEVQVLAAGGEDGLIVLPGTHSKWVRREAGRIDGFKTFMTGDLHAAVLGHTVLSILAADGEDDDAFEDGVARGHADPTMLTRLLFGGRSRVLFGELDGTAVPDYVSGLLIGAEIAAALAAFGMPDAPVSVVGGETLAGLYGRALARCGVAGEVANADRIGETYWNLAVRAGLV